jgi:hypothetical protein
MLTLSTVLSNKHNFSNENPHTSHFIAQAATSPMGCDFIIVGLVFCPFPNLL